MTGTMNQSSLMTSSQFLFGLANNLHRAIKRKNLFVGHSFQCIQRLEIFDASSVVASSDYSGGTEG